MQVTELLYCQLDAGCVYGSIDRSRDDICYEAKHLVLVRWLYRAEGVVLGWGIAVGLGPVKSDRCKDM